MNESKKSLIEDKVNVALESIRPYLQSDGGDIQVKEVTDDLIVKVKFIGACGGCPFNLQTFKASVEQAIKKEIPEVKEVIAVD
ncbi:MAG: NifU family protein [Bacteroidota bacterium]|nr:NifU family protein [Bacteroidota bacterium]MDP4228014.1 NifU family protein [Bacteroidota bacterium]MDP4274003.1 NifU family protein [Bacteroidota bacterium]